MRHPRVHAALHHWPWPFTLANAAWYRRWQGGHWERWWIDVPVASELWLDVEPCSMVNGRRPGLARGRPDCEDYP